MKKIKSYIKKFLSYAFGYDSEYTKREMSLLTRFVAVFVLCYIVMALLSYYLRIRYKMNIDVIKVIINNYAKIAVPCVSCYFVSWIGSMAKAFMAKQQYESNRTKLKLKSIENNIDDEASDEEDTESSDDDVVSDDDVCDEEGVTEDDE